METAEIAQKLAEYCRDAAWSAAHTHLYAQDAVSIEPFETPAFKKVTKGLKEIVKKGEDFDSIVVEVHSIEVSEPLVAGNSIAFVMQMDVTTKDRGRIREPELCVYQVLDGKIISEQFFV